MDKTISYPEPVLEFSAEQSMQHPRDGLSLFGPFDSKGIDRPRHITYGLFGTPQGLRACKRFFGALQHAIATPEDLDERLWSSYPGFEEVFHSVLPVEPTCEEIIDDGLLNAAVVKQDEHERVFAVVNLYMKAIEAAKKRDDAFQVFVCVVPDMVYRNCRPMSRVTEGTGQRVGARQKRRRSVMMDMFDQYDPLTYSYSVDFRRQLKARAMEHDVPIQIILESTLSTEDDASVSELTPLSDRAWNLATAMYYKAGGRPWRLSTARPGVCYVGVAFKDTEDRGQNACSAAQMFLDDGDGVVFMGHEGRWYSPKRGDYHLSRGSAKHLLSGVLESYRLLHGKPLTEIFLHCRSSINEEEMGGYQEACPAGAKLVAVRVAPERIGLRLYRHGTRPVMRGTFWPITERRGFLWGSGFKPRLGTYDGSEVPVPLCIEIQHGQADIETVARDILGLSKLNYNCCKLGEAQPVTVHFSGAVGEILVSNRHLRVVKPNFKFYI